MRSAPGIAFEVRASRILMACVATVGLLAAVAVARCALPDWMRVGLVAVACIGTLAALVRLARPAIAAVAWRSDGTWAVREQGGAEHEARLQSGRVLGALIVLRLAWAPRGRQALVLLADNLDAHRRRQLRMRLSVHADTE